MNLKTRSRITVFVLSTFVWLALTSIHDIQELMIGLLVSLLVSFIAGHFLITTEKKGHIFRRYMMAVIYFLKFLLEMIKANIHVALLVVHPKVPIHPGIVKIKTNLTKDAAITVLANSITLTPGTLTVDVNPQKHEIYVHWIQVTDKNIDGATKAIGGKFEKLLTEVFE